jgi:hypothetical protein
VYIDRERERERKMLHRRMQKNEGLEEQKNWKYEYVRGIKKEWTGWQKNVCCERGLFVCVCVRVRERESEREREREMGRKWERYFDLCKFHQFEKWFPAANMWDSLSKIRCVKLKTRWRVLKEKKLSGKILTIITNVNSDEKVLTIFQRSHSSEGATWRFESLISVFVHF